MSEKCHCCQTMPTPTNLNGLCPDCFQMLRIKPLVEARTNLLKTLSDWDKKLALAVDQLDRAGLEGDARLSILHKCICGFASLSWIETSIHIDEFGDPMTHRHEERGHLRDARPASHSAPRPIVSAASLSDEDIG